MQRVNVRDVEISNTQRVKVVAVRFGCRGRAKRSPRVAVQTRQTFENLQLLLTLQSTSIWHQNQYQLYLIRYYYNMNDVKGQDSQVRVILYLRTHWRDRWHCASHPHPPESLQTVPFNHNPKHPSNWIVNDRRCLYRWSICIAERCSKLILLLR